MKDKKLFRNSIVYVVIIVVVAIILVNLVPKLTSPEPYTLAGVIDLAKTGQIQKIIVKGDDLKIINVNGREYSAKKESGTSIYELLQNAGVKTGPNGVDVEVKGASGVGTFFGIFLNFLPLIFFGGLLFFMMRQAQGGQNSALGFGKSKAKAFNPKTPSVSFSDVAGADEAKQELAEIVEFLKNPQKFLDLGARIPKGVLLVGPPGTGKTLFARAIAGEAGVNFFSISGSEFVEMFVGVGASRVRDLFEQAKKNSPCILFIDEIDAVGRHRGAGLGGGHDEREQTLNQILVEMDGFDPTTNIILIAATNRPDILDPALLRPGRFDRKVVIDQPDVKGRQAILEVHSKGKPLANELDLELIAKITPGFSGADLANLLNEGAILAARKSKSQIGSDELQEAVDRVIAGPERKSRVISKKEKEITSYHEAGHALVAWNLPNADPPQKISIISRGMMGGYTRMVPEEERHLWNREQFVDMIATALGGRGAEEIQFGQITTGPSNDLEQATRIARQMVTKYSMSYFDNFNEEKIPISTFLNWIKEKKVKTIKVFGDDLVFVATNKKKYITKKESVTNIMDIVQGVSKQSIDIEIVSEMGLDKLGPRVYGKREELVFLGREISEQKDYGDDIAKVIDQEVNSIMSDAYKKVKSLLLENHDKLSQVAEYLILHESVEGENLKALFTSKISKRKKKTIDTNLLNGKVNNNGRRKPKDIIEPSK